MEVMTDVLVGWVQMSQYPSCFVSKAGARARSATGRLTKIVGHHELRLRGLARRTNGGTGVRQGSEFFVGRFRNTQSSPIGARFAGGTPNKSTQILKDALLDAASALGFPEEVTLLDDDGKPTGVIKMMKTPDSSK